MDFEYLWEELELSLSTQEIESLIRLLNLEKIEEARKIIGSILEEKEDTQLVIEEFKKISQRQFEMITYTKEQVLEDILNEEINVYVANVFGNVEKVAFLNLGTKENPKIKFFLGNDILGIDVIQQIWKPKYYKT